VVRRPVYRRREGVGVGEPRGEFADLGLLLWQDERDAGALRPARPVRPMRWT
jgi:hypothetical protein